MKKKLNIDRDPISGEEIASKMNFNQLLSNFPGYINPPFYKTGWFITTVASVAVLVTVTTTLLLNNGEQKDKELISAAAPPVISTEFIYEEDTKCVNPPIKKLDIPTDSYYCNNEEGAEFLHPTGSIITIPKNSFVDKNGNSLTGEIELRYREFRDPIDFILSGIPMTYDSAGTEYTFESAGMVEIYGFQNGKPVEIADGKAIHIAMTPENGSSRFNLYELDTTSGKWSFKGKPELVMETVDESTGEIHHPKVIEENLLQGKTHKQLKETETELAVATKEIIDYKKTAPQKPKTSVNKDRQFNLDVDPKEFPELRNYDQLTFEVDKNDKSFSTDVYSIEWDNVSLSENRKGNSYYLTLYKGSAKRTFSVHPIFEGQNYKKAMATFEQKFDTYEKELKKRVQKELVIKEKLEKQKALYEMALLEQEKIKAQMRANQLNSMALIDNNRKIMVVARAFNITQFGTWNCDSPIGRPSGAKVAASFTDNVGKNLGLHHVNLIEKNKNAVFTYSEDKYNSFKFNPKETNTIVGFTNDDKLAIVRFTDLGNHHGRKHKFEMEIIDISTLTVKNIKEKLNL